MIGERIDKYSVISRIGEGGMATVYLGEHVTLNRKVAVKVLHPHLSASPKNRQRFEREARAIEHLQHPNILRIFDFSGPEVEQCYIVTEFVQGSTLRELLEDQGIFASEVAAFIGIQLADALGYAHKSGVVHRDLKPENAMIREDGVVKLMDFGIARFLDESNITMTGALVGSPAYMSPEQVLEREIGPKSDLFSLGSMLYQLVTGRLPFAGSNPSIILRKVIDGTRVPVLECNPSVAPALAELIEDLLSPDPAGRPTDAKRVQTRLKEVLTRSRFDLSDKSWSLAQWLEDPPSYDERLDAHLQSTLMEQGRAALQKGKHRDARMAFNRLLALDPEQTEVLAMLSDIPTWHGENPQRKHWLSALSALLLIALGVGSWWWTESLEPSNTNHTSPTLPDEGLDPDLQTEGVDEALEDLPSKTNAPHYWSDPSGTPPTELTERPAELGSSAAKPSRPAPSPDKPVETKDRPEPTALQPASLEIQLALEAGQAGWADIYIDGRRVGRWPKNRVIRDLVPGVHDVQVSNTFGVEYLRTIELEPGEHLVLDGIRLERRPSSAVFRAELHRECQVLIRNSPVGNLEELKGVYPLAEPSDIGELSLACPNGETHGPFNLNPPAAGENVTIPP